MRPCLLPSHSRRPDAGGIPENLSPALDCCHVCHSMSWISFPSGGDRRCRTVPDLPAPDSRVDPLENQDTDRKRKNGPKGGRPSRKEVFQPHLPVRLPCYDLAPITGLTLGRSSRLRTSGTPGFHGLTGGVYKARERIHRAMADARLLANPASWSRVADSSPNWEGISGLDTGRPDTALCTPHCNTCVAPDVRAVLI